MLEGILSDETMPLNVESREQGGVGKIAAKVKELLKGFDSLDMTVF